MDESDLCKSRTMEEDHFPPTKVSSQFVGTTHEAWNPKHQDSTVFLFCWKRSTFTTFQMLLYVRNWGKKKKKAWVQHDEKTKSSIICISPVVPAHAMQEYRGSTGTFLLILNLSTRCRWVLNFKRRPLYPQEKSPPSSHWIGDWVAPRTSLEIF